MAGNYPNGTRPPFTGSRFVCRRWQPRGRRCLYRMKLHELASRTSTQLTLTYAPQRRHIRRAWSTAAYFESPLVRRRAIWAEEPRALPWQCRPCLGRPGAPIDPAQPLPVARGVCRFHSMILRLRLQTAPCPLKKSRTTLFPAHDAGNAGSRDAAACSKNTFKAARSRFLPVTPPLAPGPPTQDVAVLVASPSEPQEAEGRKPGPLS